MVDKIMEKWCTLLSKIRFILNPPFKCLQKNRKICFSHNFPTFVLGKCELLRPKETCLVTRFCLEILAKHSSAKMNEWEKIFYSQLANYVMWHAVNGLVSTLSRPFRDALRDLKKALMGGEGETIRWRDCIDDTTNTFGYAMGGLFVKTHFNGSAKAQVSSDATHGAFNHSSSFIHFFSFFIIRN